MNFTISHNLAHLNPSVRALAFSLGAKGFMGYAHMKTLRVGQDGE